MERKESAIGVVGVGAIAEDIVEGLRAAGVRAPILLSPRGAERARRLAARHEGVEVAADNRAVAAAAQTLFLAVRPADVDASLVGAEVRPGTLVISAVAGCSVETLGEILGPNARVVRSIPMPPVRTREGVTALFPADAEAERLFGLLGSTVVAETEEAFNALSAATATVSTHLAYLEAITGWLGERGWQAGDADAFVRGIYQRLTPALADPSHTLAELASGHETPQGLNEQVRTTWFDAENCAALQATLDEVYARVRG